MSDKIEWVAHLDRNFSWITVGESDGVKLAPVVARDLSEKDCARIVRAVNDQHALCAVAKAAGLVQCACTAMERESGHKTDCWMPQLEGGLSTLAAIRWGKDGD